jgi:tRNA dimethylallyltransferase
MVSETRVIGILTGPTATGKTGLALTFARRYPGIEIINADSLLVYREMNIGTAKPSRSELEQTPHHLIDVSNPDQVFTAGEFKREAEAAIAEIISRGKKPLIVGGTGFYLKSLLFGLWKAPAADLELREKLEENTNLELYLKLETIDPVAAHRIGQTDRYRLVRALELFQLSGQTPSALQSAVPKDPDPRFKLWVIDRPLEELYQRIEMRTQLMLEQGLIEEYKALDARFPKARSLQAIGYAQVRDYLAGITPPGRKIKAGIAGLQEEITLATRQLVKQQRTWFRGLIAKVPESKWFLLDADHAFLEEAAESVYKD